MTRLICRAALLCAVASLAAAPASRPSVYTQHDEAAVTLAYNRRTLDGAYDAVGQKDPKWDAPAHAVLERMAVRFSDYGFGLLYDTGTTAADTNDSLAALADAAKDCPDPLVGYCRASLYRAVGRTDDYLALLREVAPKIIDGPYPVYRRMTAANAMSARFKDEPQWAKQRDALAVDVLLEKTADPRERRFILNRVIELLWNDGEDFRGVSFPVKGAERQTLIDALAAHPDADPWTLNMLRGYHGIAFAWEFRGSGYANTVTPAGWAGFRRHIALARTALTAAYEAEPNYPESSAAMCTVCMAESVDGREWFDRAITAQIDFMNAWGNYGESVRPRWGGTMKALLDLGREAVQTGRFDTMTPYFMENAVNMMRQENAIGDAVYRVPGVWDALDDMFDGYLKALPRGLQVPWNASRRAAYAWKCGQYAEAKRTLDLVGDQIEPTAFDSFGVELSEVRDECNARTGPTAGAIKKLDVQETLKRFAAAADGYAKLMAGLAKNDPARPFCARRQVINRIAATLAEGKPVELPLNDPDTLAAWRGDTAAWKLDAGELVFTGKNNAEARIVHAAVLPDTCRIRVEWSWTSAGKNKPGLDVVFRRTVEQGDISVDSVPRDRVVAVRLGGKYNLGAWQWPEGDSPLGPDAWHTLTLHCDPETIGVEHDGQSILHDQKNEWLHIGKPVVGLTAHSGPGETTVRVRKIVIEPAE